MDWAIAVQRVTWGIQQCANMAWRLRRVVVNSSDLANFTHEVLNPRGFHLDAGYRPGRE